MGGLAKGGGVAFSFSLYRVVLYVRVPPYLGSLCLDLDHHLVLTRAGPPPELNDSAVDGNSAKARITSG